MPKDTNNGRRPTAEMLRAECEALAPVLDAVEGYTIPHATRIASLAERIARTMGLTDEMCFDLRLAALVHDIGEQALHMSFLRQDRALNFTERLELWRHPVVGEQQAAKRNLPVAVQLLIRWHHENWDGTGYPDGLRGTNIPLPARILRAADVFNTLTALRPFRPAYTPTEALDVIRQLAGFALDPMVVEVLIHLERTQAEFSQTAQPLIPVIVEPEVEAPRYTPPQPTVHSTQFGAGGEVVETHGDEITDEMESLKGDEPVEITAEFEPVSAPFNMVSEAEDQAGVTEQTVVREEPEPVEHTAEFAPLAVPFAVSVEPPAVAGPTASEPAAGESADVLAEPSQPAGSDETTTDRVPPEVTTEFTPLVAPFAVTNEPEPSPPPPEPAAESEPPAHPVPAAETASQPAEVPVDAPPAAAPATEAAEPVDPLPVAETAEGPEAPANPPKEVETATGGEDR